MRVVMITVLSMCFQLEVHKPLVNLLDNLVTMGSLYGGDNLMMASQYKKVQIGLENRSTYTKHTLHLCL